MRSHPVDEVELLVVAQLQSLTIDEALLNETCLRVRKSVAEKGQEIERDLTVLARYRNHLQT